MINTVSAQINIDKFISAAIPIFIIFVIVMMLGYFIQKYVVEEAFKAGVIIRSHEKKTQENSDKLNLALVWIMALAFLGVVSFVSWLLFREDNDTNMWSFIWLGLGALFVASLVTKYFLPDRWVFPLIFFQPSVYTIIALVSSFLLPEETDGQDSLFILTLVILVIPTAFMAVNLGSKAHQLLMKRLAKPVLDRL